MTPPRPGTSETWITGRPRNSLATIKPSVAPRRIKRTAARVGRRDKSAPKIRMRPAVGPRIRDRKSADKGGLEAAYNSGLMAADGRRGGERGRLGRENYEVTSCGACTSIRFRLRCARQPPLSPWQPPFSSGLSPPARGPTAGPGATKLGTMAQLAHYHRVPMPRPCPIGRASLPLHYAEGRAADKCRNGLFGGRGLATRLGASITSPGCCRSSEVSR
ncbi:hypothetical protein KM043_010205 [Ampulex compressa]|nr:hypothetical protein KM043_010205 [Ampulex compressa]